MRHKTDTVALKVLFTIGVSLLTLGTSITSQAAEEKNITNCMDFQNIYGLEAKYSGVYFNTEYEIFRELGGNIVGLTVSDDAVTIDYSDEESFVDAIAMLDDGSSEYVSDIAEWTSSNNQVANVYNGRINAVSTGSCIITVSYEGYSTDIEVNVLAYRDTLEEIQLLNANILQQNLARVADSQVVNVAKEMTEYTWTPQKKLIGWNGHVFEAGVAVTGIPYSQSANQVNKNLFASALLKADFYDSCIRSDGTAMPKYGNDCSGFVSYSWGISRNTTSSFISGIRSGTYKKVGSYNANSHSTSELKEAYKSLQPGNAVVKSGHTFLIASNDVSNSRVYVYEQTPPKAIYRSWTYSSMASNGYMPFAR